jgi:lipopolysaccharide export system permease protein
MFKNKLKNYLTLEIVKSYLFVLATLTLLIWVTQAARLLYLITDTGLSIATFAEYIFLLIPKTISQVMIISFLISLFINIIKLQNNKELEIYWLAGISKNEIISLIFTISLFFTFLAFVFYIFIAPASGNKSRNVIANAEFSLINALVKKNNFNSPLKDLTIFVNKNDNQGNLEKIYIFEKNKTIISKKGRVLNINEKNYLELLDGIIHEKNDGNNIVSVKFEKTLFDFTKYQSNIITTPKLGETNFSMLIEGYNKNKNKNALYEIHKRIFKPLLIPLVALLCCFTLYGNNEKINLNKIKIFIFIISTLIIILMEVLLNLSSINIIFQYILYGFPILFGILIFTLLNKFLQSETRSA